MKIQYKSIGLISLIIICSNVYAQPGYFVDLAWHGKTTTLNHAYGSYLDNGSGTKEIEIHRDGFYITQKQRKTH